MFQYIPCDRCYIHRRKYRHPQLLSSSFIDGLWNWQFADFIPAFTIQSSFQLLALTETWVCKKNTPTPATICQHLLCFLYTPCSNKPRARTGLLISIVRDPLNKTRMLLEILLNHTLNCHLPVLLGKRGQWLVRFCYLLVFFYSSCGRNIHTELPVGSSCWSHLLFLLHFATKCLFKSV